MARTLDVSDAVRRQAYTVLATKGRMSNLSLEERACLLRRGLQDRSTAACSAAVSLVQAWLVHECEESILELLSHLDVRRYPGNKETIPCLQLCSATPSDETSLTFKLLPLLNSHCHTQDEIGELKDSTIVVTRGMYLADTNLKNYKYAQG